MGRPSAPVVSLFNLSLLNSPFKFPFKFLDISRSLIAQWERSAVSLKADQLLALADSFGITIDSLLGRNSSTAKRGSGPVGRARQVFDRVSKLPRSTQQRILANVEDALTAYEVRKAG